MILSFIVHRKLLKNNLIHLFFKPPAPGTVPGTYLGTQ